MADLSRNCKGFRTHESVHARVTESRAQGMGVGRDIRQSPSRVRSVFLLIYAIMTCQKVLVKTAAQTEIGMQNYLLPVTIKQVYSYLGDLFYFCEIRHFILCCKILTQFILWLCSHLTRYVSILTLSFFTLN